MIHYKPDAMTLRNTVYTNRNATNLDTSEFYQNYEMKKPMHERSKDKIKRYIRSRSKSELMSENDFIKILPNQHDFGGAFTGDRENREDLIVQGESKLEREAMSAIGAIDDK